MTQAPMLCEVSTKEWNDWHWQIRNRICSLERLENIISLSYPEKKALISTDTSLPFSITPYYASLLDRNNPQQPIRKSVIPTIYETETSNYEDEDPLSEHADSIFPNLIHRYPDRVLFLVTDFCSTYCRYCTRSRIVGGSDNFTSQQAEWDQAIEYIESRPQIRDVLLSGGDPLTLSDTMLEKLLSRLRKIKHVEIIRIGTKVPAVLPQRITPSLTEMIRKYHPVWMSLHFTHPDELTPETSQACSRLSDAGIPLMSQTVLLSGINDAPGVLKTLFQGLLRIRVKPYYLYQCDPVKGTAHFRTSLETGQKIINEIQGYTSGYAVPLYVIDAPGGGGKIPVMPNRIIHKDLSNLLYLKNYKGEIYGYYYRPNLRS